MYGVATSGLKFGLEALPSETLDELLLARLILLGTFLCLSVISQWGGFGRDPGLADLRLD